MKNKVLIGVVLAIMAIGFFRLVSAPKEKTTTLPPQLSPTAAELIPVTARTQPTTHSISLLPISGFATPADYVQNAWAAIGLAGRQITVTGKIAQATALIRATVSDPTPLNSSYDGVWLYVENGQFLGGQLDWQYYQDSNNKSGDTFLSVDLNHARVAKNLQAYLKKDFQEVNLTNLLTDGAKVGTLVSTARAGLITSFSINYICEADTDCSITLKE